MNAGIDRRSSRPLSSDALAITVRDASALDRLLSVQAGIVRAQELESRTAAIQELIDITDEPLARALASALKSRNRSEVPIGRQSGDVDWLEFTQDGGFQRAHNTLIGIDRQAIRSPRQADALFEQYPGVGSLPPCQVRRLLAQRLCEVTKNPDAARMIEMRRLFTKLEGEFNARDFRDLTEIRSEAATSEVKGSVDVLLRTLSRGYRSAKNPDAVRFLDEQAERTWRNLLGVVQNPTLVKHFVTLIGQFGVGDGIVGEVIEYFDQLRGMTKAKHSNLALLRRQAALEVLCIAAREGSPPALQKLTQIRDDETQAAQLRGRAESGLAEL